MGYLLKEALKTLCGVNQWSYAIFWKIGCQNPKLLIWEECYYEPVIYSNGMHGVEARNKVHLLVTKMMKDNYINLFGEGLVGRVAFTGNHQWISDTKMLGSHPLEVSNEVRMQFSAGMQTIAIIPVHPHGVVQFGSSLTIMENMGFVNDVKSLIFQLGFIPGALLSENYAKNEGGSDTSQSQGQSQGEPMCFGSSISSHSSGKSKVTACTLFTPDSCNEQGQSPQGSRNRRTSGSTLPSPINCRSFVKSDESHYQAKVNPLMEQNVSFRGFEDSKYDESAFGSFVSNYDPLRSMEPQILVDPFGGDHFNNAGVDEQPTLTCDKGKLEHELFEALSMSSEEACFKPPSGDDLFDIVGVNFKNKLFDGNRNNYVNNGSEANQLNLVRNNGASADLFSVNEGESDSGIYSLTTSDHLLDAVVSQVHSFGQLMTPLTKTSTSVASSSSNWGINMMQGELTGVPMSLKKPVRGLTKEDMGSFSENGSIISSQISSWVDHGHDMRKSTGVSSGYSKKTDEIGKSNRKRVKPGENPRPRPKDRQMIQDRVKELREIVPNGGKCSIDALLERTIKHMLFLQSVTKHADKLKQTGESKIVSKEGGLLLRDNFEGGATWAYEVGSQSMACPIIVEDLNSPRQMLVEMLCEERGLFLEIADIVRGLGLTILKGVMESRNDKIWAHFTVEANRDVTRMEIFISLVGLLEQNVKNHEPIASAM